MCGGFGAFYFRTEIKQKNKQKNLKITPVKHCTNFPLINSTLCFCGDGFHKWTELDFWIWTNQGMNWPGRPSDLLNSTNLPLRPLSEHWPPGFPSPPRCRVFTLIRSLFFFLFICLLPWHCFCGLVAQRLNEECVQKPSPERTHSEGTSRRTEHHKRRNTARRRTRTDVVTPFVLCLSDNLYVVVLFCFFLFQSVKHCSSVWFEQWLWTGLCFT